MQTDHSLKARQPTWDTPRNIAILLAVVTVVFCAVGGFIGYTLGQNATPTIVINMPPGSTTPPSITIGTPPPHP